MIKHIVFIFSFIPLLIFAKETSQSEESTSQEHAVVEKQQRAPKFSELDLEEELAEMDLDEEIPLSLEEE